MRGWIAAIFLGSALLVFWGPAAAQAHQETLSAETVRSELTTLYDKLESAHFDLFAHRDEQAYRAFLDQQLSTVTGSMSAAQAAILFQELAAYGQVGHARIDAASEQFVSQLRNGGQLLPVFIRVDGDRTLLTETADVDGRFLAGDEILRLNGEDIAVWLERLGRYVSAERPYMTRTLMEQSFPVLLSFALGNADAVSLTVRKPSGETVTGEVPAITLSERAEIRRDHATPKLQTDFSRRAFELMPMRIGYLRPGPFAEPQQGADPNYDSTAFDAFIDQSFEQLIAAGATDLILDLRNNPGGDNSFSDHLVAWFADGPFRFASSFTLKASAESKAWYDSRIDQAGEDPSLEALAQAEAAHPNGTRYIYDLPLNQPRPGLRFGGAVHVLINRHSYSNAASVAAMIQDYGFGEILGEETADVPTTYASVLTFELPTTGIIVTYPKSRIVRPSGDEALRGVDPDVPLAREPLNETSDVVLNDAISVILARRMDRVD